MSDSQDFRKQLAKMQKAIARSLESKPLTNPSLDELLEEYGVAGSTRDLEARLRARGIVVESAWAPLSPNREAVARNLIRLILRERERGLDEKMNDSDASSILEDEGCSTDGTQHESESRRQQKELVNKITQLESKRKKCLTEIRERDAELELLQTNISRLEKNVEKVENGIQTSTIDSGNFAKYRLSPILRHLNPNFSNQDALEIHATILSQALTPVSSMVIVRAYQEAIGPCARPILLPVSPAWLTFDDAWSSGFCDLWKTCSSNPDVLFLVTLYRLEYIVADNGWLDTLLAMAQGNMDKSAELSWPKNLRFFGVVEDDQNPSDQQAWLNHFLMLRFGLNGRTTRLTLPEGQTTLETWMNWVPAEFPIRLEETAHCEPLLLACGLMEDTNV